jgi:release factor glutamine methyltransferase
MKLQDLIRQTRQRFQDSGLITPDLDARFLIQDLLHLSDTDLISSSNDVTPDQISLIESAIQRRLAGEPVSRILGYREFWGRKFFLSAATLDPRPDTETLIEAALGWVKTHPKDHPLRILDLGTGTGCILLTLIHEIPDSIGVGIDISEEACKTARRNADEQKISSRVTIQCSDWVQSLSGTFDLIVSNPPYIPTHVIPSLSAEVQNHDPILALDGGMDGLEPYKFLLSNLKKFLEPGGVVFFEIGDGQLADLTGLVRDSGATLSRVHNDLGGVSRVVEIGYGDN